MKNIIPASKASVLLLCNTPARRGTGKINSRAVKVNSIAGIKGTILLFFMLVCFGMTSCIVTYDARTTQIEIMKPALFNIPESIKTVALINGVSKSQDNQPFKYSNYYVYKKDIFNDHESKPFVTDSTIKYRDLSNACIDALAWQLKKEGYFSNVVNYHDSLIITHPSDKNLFIPEKLFQKTESDLCIFLDHVSFDVEKIKDFEAVINTALLSWTIVYKKDSLSYTYKQRDTLTFVHADFPPDLTDNMKIKMVVNNSSTFLGQSFCSKIIPTWIPVDRLYYTSDNLNMLQAERFALTSDWLKAAAIWNKQTINNNPMIAAKASYNMALACEMEGKLDEAIEWLVHSSSILKKKNEIHQLNCQHYISVLIMRKKEIEKLGLQIRKE